jgi:serine/threonine-protein kinase
MGTVALALRKEGRFRRFCAVKRMHPHLRTDPDCRAMFLEEARIAGVLSHPNIVSVIDVGEDDSGPYLVMDFVEGVPLSELLRSLSAEHEKMPLQLSLRIALDVARGLGAAHEAIDHDGEPLHIVHRDVSPQNILISFDGTVRITDFGIARALGRAVRTTTGVVKGKLAYMSPEQLRHERVDLRSDLYSLGVVLYEMLSGDRLYKGEEVAHAILNDPPPDIGELRRDLPPDLVSLTFELLAKDRSERPEDAASAVMRLEAILYEVLASREPMDLRTFVRATAGAQREEQRALLATAEERAEAQSPSPRPSVDPIAETVAATPSSRSQPTASRAVSLGLALTIVLALMGAGWMLLSPSGSSGSREGEDTSAPPRDDGPRDGTAERPEPPPTTDRSAVPAEIRQAEAESNPVVAPPAASVSVADERRRRPAGPRRSSKTSTGVTSAPTEEPTMATMTVTGEMRLGIVQMPWEPDAGMM